MLFSRDPIRFRHDRAGRGIVFLSLVFACGYVPAALADQAVLQNQGTRSWVENLYYQPYAAHDPALIASPAQPLPTPTSQNSADTAIKSDVAKLFGEKYSVTGSVPQVATSAPAVAVSVMPAPVTPASIPAPAYASVAPAAAAVPAPAAPVVAVPVAGTNLYSGNFTGVPAPSPQAVAQSLKGSSATIPSRQEMAGLAVKPSVLKTGENSRENIVPEAPMTGVAYASGFSDQESASFIRNLIGKEGVALNVVDAPAPADIQVPVHLDEAVALALKNNFEVQAANEKSKGAYWDKMGAYSEYLPNVQVSADTGPERSQPAAVNDQFGNRILDNTHNRQDHSIAVTQPFIDLTIISDILSGTDKQHIADADQQDVREGIAYDTAAIYLSLLQSRISVRLADNYKHYLDDLAQRMEARVAGGGASSADLDRIRSRSTAAESARIEALGEYQSNLAEFKRLTKVMPAQLVVPNLLAPPVPTRMQDAMEKALKSNPSYVSALKKIDLASDDKDKSFAGLLPKLSGQYTNSYTFNAGGSAEGSPVDGVYPVQKTQTVMLVAQWAFGGPSVAGGLSGMAKEREMTLRSLDIRARIEQGIQSGYAAINAAHERETVLQRSVDADEHVVTSFEQQYSQGGRSLFDMLDAYEQLYTARLNLLRVVIAEAKAAYQVRRQMGELRQSILASESPGNGKQ